MCIIVVTVELCAIWFFYLFFAHIKLTLQSFKLVNFIQKMFGLIFDQRHVITHILHSGNCYMHDMFSFLLILSQLGNHR